MLVSKFSLENQFRIWSEVRRVQYTLRFWLQVPMGEIGQDRTLLPATCMVLGSHMQNKQGKQRRAGEETRGEESNSEIFGF